MHRSGTGALGPTLIWWRRRVRSTHSSRNSERYPGSTPVCFPGKHGPFDFAQVPTCYTSRQYPRRTNLVLPPDRERTWGLYATHIAKRTRNRPLRLHYAPIPMVEAKRPRYKGRRKTTINFSSQLLNASPIQLILPTTSNSHKSPCSLASPPSSCSPPPLRLSPQLPLLTMPLRSLSAYVSLRFST